MKYEISKSEINHRLAAITKY